MRTFLILVAFALILLATFFFLLPQQPPPEIAPPRVLPETLPPQTRTATPDLAPVISPLAMPNTHTPSPPQPDPVSALPSLNALNDRQAYYETLLTQPSAVLWQQWQALQQTQDPNAIRARQLIGMALPIRLRAQPDVAVYNALAANLSLPETTAYGQVSQIAQLLGQTATRPAIAALVENALNLPLDSETRIPILQAIVHSTQLRWDNQFHAELSPPLEQAWQQLQTSKDIALVNTISQGLAEIGTTDGLTQLFNTLQPVNESSLQSLQENEQVAPLSAFHAFENLSNPAAQALLTATLHHAPPNSLTQRAAGQGLTALAALGHKTAAQQLWQWSQQAPANMQAQIAHWLDEITTRRPELLQQVQQ